MPVLAKDDKFILYIHVPKTGGSFVENFFHKNGFLLDYIDRGMRCPNFNFVRRISPQHMHAALLMQEFILERFDHIFMTVRHPVQRLKSEYRMRLDLRAPEDFNDWFERVFAEYQADPYVYDNHIRPQWEFAVKGTCVFRQEDKFDEAWAADIGRKFGVQLTEPHFDLAETSHHKEPYALGVDAITSKNKERILTLYKKDFEIFGYKPEF